MDVTVNVCNQDNEPLKKASVWIENKAETYTTDKDGNIELGQIEEDTHLEIFAGYCSDYIAGHESVTVSKGMTLPIKIRLNLDKVTCIPRKKVHV